MSTHTRTAPASTPTRGVVPAAAVKAAALSPAEKKVARAQAKVDNFKKLAVKRVNKVLYSLNGVTALSNRNSYAFDETQVKKIFDALEASVSMAKKKFESPTAGGDGFSL